MGPLYSLFLIHHTMSIPMLLVTRDVGQLWTHLGIINWSGRGVAESTLRSYAAGKKCYITFCSQFNCRPLPVTEATLLRFTAHLASLGLSYQTTHLYLCAVCHLQIVSKLPEPSLTSYPLLNYSLRGFVEESVEESHSLVYQALLHHMVPSFA